MTLSIFKENFVNTLRAAVGSNLTRYKDDDPWIHEFAGNRNWNLETPLEVKAPQQLAEPSGDNLKDFENAIRVHKAFPNLTPVQARDPRLWTKLCHVDCWSYMRKRWPIEDHIDDEGKAIRNTVKHYFISRSDSRGLLENGIAGLWWFAKLTFDETRENPYELTAILLSKLDIAQQILERNLGRAPAVLLGFLEFLLLNKDQLLISGNASRNKIRLLAKFLNLSGGFCLLDSLSKKEVVALLEEEYARILSEPSEV